MTGKWRFVIAGSVMAMLLALGACGRSFVTSGERAAWRHQAEAACIKSGAIKTGAAVVQIEPIQGPGMCGADFPLKVAALGTSSAVGYGEEPRPPGAIRNNPLSASRYGAPVQGQPVQTQPVLTRPVSGETLRWTPGPAAVDRQGPSTSAPVSLSPPGSMQQERPQDFAPRSPTPRMAPLGKAQPIDDDVPDDAVLPSGRSAPRTRPAYNAPSYNAPRGAPNANAPDDDEDEAPQRGASAPAYGPVSAPSVGRGQQRIAMASAPAALAPAATLACPLVSALDRWVAEGVQPAAQKWFGSQVATIKQISAYSCRGMVGAGTSHVSEHAFGNALDIAGFVLADGRKISVKDGWRGSPEEQGFLHDVQLNACDTFSTVLAPGYNAAHYDHIHVDLMRRASGRRPCRPNAISGDVAAAKARSMYAAKHGREYTGSIGPKGGRMTPESKTSSKPGEDGDFDDDAVTGSISNRDRNALKAIAGEDGDFDDDDAEVTTGSVMPRPLPTLVPPKTRSPSWFRDVPP